MASDITNLEPKRVWHYFNQICRHPHGSGNEEPLRKYIIKVAEELKLKYKTDAVGNILVMKDASPEFKNAKPLAFQCHMDMVCEAAPDSKHDFLKDPIVPKADGEWVTSGVTTLGADNGIGIAACLAILEDKELKHGPLECLFTMTEETGLDGAFGLKPDMLSARTLINLDSEDEGLFFVGCAGGGDTIIKVPTSKKTMSKEFMGLCITVDGLQGGHSGLTIHEQRGNALKILARILYPIHATQEIYLASLAGGTRRNVIPSFAEAVIAIRKHKRAKVVSLIEEVRTAVSEELKKIDPNLQITIKDVEVTEAFSAKPTSRIISMLNAAHHGVITMSYDIAGLVQTSTNLAAVRMDGDDMSIQFLSRSSSATEIEAVRSSLRALAELAGGEIEEPGGYPGWQPNLSSKILALMKRTYKEMFGKDAGHAAVHAGLECGIIGEKYPGMDMASVGPSIEGAHSIKERVNIRSTKEFYELLKKIVENFAKG